MGNIKLRCQTRDLKSEVTCYIIDADTSYNLLLGRLWIHRNSIILSTLYHVMKYANKRERVRTLITKKHLFKGVENYIIDSLIYQDSLETAKNLQPEEPDSGNEADTEQWANEESF